MSAYDDAYEVWWFTQQPMTPALMKRCINSFLAALPPSITVGELLDAAREVARGGRQ